MSLKNLKAKVQQQAGAAAHVRVWPHPRVACRVQLTCRMCGWHTPSDGRVPGQGSTAQFALDALAAHRAARHALFTACHDAGVPDPLSNRSVTKKGSST